MPEQIGHENPTTTTELADEQPNRPKYAGLVSGAFGGMRPEEISAHPSTGELNPVIIPAQEIKGDPFPDASLAKQVRKGRQYTAPADLRGLTDYSSPAIETSTPTVQLPVPATGATEGLLKTLWKKPLVKLGSLAMVPVTAFGIYNATKGGNSEVKQTGTPSVAAANQVPGNPNTGNQLVLPDREFSSILPTDDAPESVVEQGPFQNFSQEKKDFVRKYEAMRFDEFEKAPVQDRLAYVQYLVQLSAGYIVDKYQKEAPKYGYPQLPQSTIDAYKNGVTEATPASDLEGVQMLRQVFVTYGFFEKNIGQDRTTGQYTQNPTDTGYVYNLAEAEKALNILEITPDGSTNTDIQKKIDVPGTPDTLIDSNRILPNLQDPSKTQETPVFNSINFDVFQDGTYGSLSHDNHRLKIDHYESLGIKLHGNGGDPVGQTIYMYYPNIKNLLTDKTMTLAVPARRDNEASTGFYPASQLPIFSGPGY